MVYTFVPALHMAMAVYRHKLCFKTNSRAEAKILSSNRIHSTLWVSKVTEQIYVLAAKRKCRISCDFLEILSCKK